MTTITPRFHEFWPQFVPLQQYQLNTALNSSSWVIDATGEKIALVGKHWNSARATKNIRKVGFLPGAITKAGGSGWTLSLQDLDAAGSIISPDGTQDQTVAISAASITANTWYETGNLSADRSLAFGAEIAVVIEFDGGGRLGADSFAVSVATLADSPFAPRHTQPLLYTASWSALNVSRVPIVGFIYDDGTYGGLEYVSPISARNIFGTFNSASTPDEYATEFIAPFDCYCDGALAHVFVTNTSTDFDFILYDSANNVLGSNTLDGNKSSDVGGYRRTTASWAPVQIVAGSTYRLAIKATTANNIAIPYVDFPSTAWKAVSEWPVNWGTTSRTDGGSWAAVTQTRVMGMSLRISEYTIGRSPSFSGFASQ